MTQYSGSTPTKQTRYKVLEAQAFQYMLLIFRSKLMARRLSALPLSLIVLLVLLPSGAVVAAGQSTMPPAPVVASSTTTVGTGLNQPQSVGVDNAGDVFVANANGGSVVEFPSGGGAQITLATGLSYDEGLAVDSSGNIYATSFGGTIYKIPAGGGANSGVSFVSGSTCPDYAAMGYYIPFDHLSADGVGNIYALGGQSYLLEFDQAGDCTERLTPTQLGSTTPGTVGADAAGDLYYSIGTSLYYLPAGSSTPTQVAVAANAIGEIDGLTVDSAGNLYISDTNSIDEIPFINGALAPQDIIYLTPFAPPSTLAVDRSGAIYASNFNANTVQRTVIGSIALGSSAVGTAGAAGVVTYVFNTAVTPVAFSYVSGSGTTTQFATAAAAAGVTTTCATGTAYPASTPATVSSCTLNVALNASTPGKVTGAVLLQTAASTLVATNLSGTGMGAGLSVSPGMQTALGTFTAPTAVSVDGSGNTFVADSSTNTVTEIPAGGGTAVTVASGLNAPQGLAVDPAGNLFIANTGSNQIVEVPVVGGALKTAGQTTVATGLNAPLGLAMDVYGDLLIANSGAGDVLELPVQGGVVSALPAFAIGKGFQKPTAIAVDANNNIFVGDATAAEVVEITAPAQQTTVLSNLAQISGIALDANDDIFLTQTGVATVTQIAVVGGAYATNATVPLGAGLVGPQGIALDNAADLYVADPMGGAADEIQRTLGALNFGQVNIGLTSAAQSLLLSDSGNRSLTINSPFYTVASGASADFSVIASANNGCGGTLAAGASCDVSATFSPAALGAAAETISFQTNAANAASIGATLSGTGANQAPTTLGLSASPMGSINFGQTVTVTAVVATQTSSTSTPTGTVQFIVDGADYGGSVGLGPNGTVVEPITGLSGGMHTIDASYSGDTSFASSAATTPLSITIATAPTTTSLTATISGSTAVPTGSSVTFTATVAPTFTPPPYPSGSVTFFMAGNTTALGTAPLTNGVASLTVATLPNGQYNITAVYSGDSDFSTSTSAGYAVYVSPPTFLLSSVPTSLSVPAHGSASLSFTINPIAGYTGSVFPSCSGLPVNTTCTFSPGGVDFMVTPGPQSVQLTVQTSIPPPSTAGFFIFPSVLALLALLFFHRRKALPRLLTIAILLAGGAVASMSLSGCSGGGNSASPAGTSMVTVQLMGSAAAAGSSNISQTFSFNLQVQ
jgi:sugar lactone lactonase YvrE